jgi:uncharacterized protein YbaR (Trm112 family)
VLEVGAGANPYPRANVLLDGFESSIERYDSDLIRDRPLVLGVCENLPFRNQAFDFVIASHVLEHTDQPEQFLAELMRVARAGYIETPDALFEKMCPFMFHRLEVAERNGTLLIRKKTAWENDKEVATLFASRLSHDKHFAHMYRLHPDSFYTRYYWSGSISYTVTNPADDASWPYPEGATDPQPPRRNLKRAFRRFYLRIIRRLTSQGKRNHEIDLFALLRCPGCAGETLIRAPDHLTCKKCGEVFPIKDGIPRMFPSQVSGANAHRSDAAAR